MPKLPFDDMCADLDDSEARIICAAQNSRNDCLRVTKPYKHIDFDGDLDEALFKASVNYVWRMLCFDYCGFTPHSCLPITADWDIGAVFYNREKQGDFYSYKERRDAEKSVVATLDALVKRAESVLPITAQVGVMRWGKALGMIQ